MPDPAPPTILDLPPLLARQALADWVKSEGLPGYRTGQLFRRLWATPVASWADATELPAALRTRLDAALPLPRLRRDTVQLSRDGTRKYLWRLPDGEVIGSVLIPSGGRRTLCISSQAGCALGCVFCATGQMGFQRNLSAGEITDQVIHARRHCSEPLLRNLVFMGMGEPLLNLEAVIKAVRQLSCEYGLELAQRRMTISTAGMCQGNPGLVGGQHDLARQQAARPLPHQRQAGLRVGSKVNRFGK